ncbi:MAG TPA: hypothetical protein GXX37_15520 [Clostridiaceae bacterium]|nr:hypothetical protein [Clostridiaceae bacterium]
MFKSQKKSFASIGKEASLLSMTGIDRIIITCIAYINLSLAYRGKRLLDA